MQGYTAKVSEIARNTRTATSVEVGVRGSEERSLSTPSNATHHPATMQNSLASVLKPNLAYLQRNASDGQSIVGLSKDLNTTKHAQYACSES